MIKLSSAYLVTILLAVGVSTYPQHSYKHLHHFFISDYFNEFMVDLTWSKSKL